MSGDVVDAGRRRGVAPTILLVLQALVSGAVTVALVVFWVDEAEYGGAVPVSLVFALAAVALQVLSVVGMWLWRRWGLRLFAAATAGVLVLDLVRELSGLVVSGKFVLACAVAFAVLPLWDHMRD